MTRYNIGDTATLKRLYSITDSRGQGWGLQHDQAFALDLNSHALHIVDKDFKKLKGFKKITGYTLRDNNAEFHYANGVYGTLNALNETTTP